MIQLRYMDTRSVYKMWSEGASDGVIVSKIG